MLHHYTALFVIPNMLALYFLNPSPMPHQRTSPEGLVLSAPGSASARLYPCAPNSWILSRTNIAQARWYALVATEWSP